MYRDEEAHKIIDDAKKTYGKNFQNWLDRPETKFMLSLLPPTPEDKQEAFKLLLRSAFDAGCGSGEGAALVSMMGALVKPKRP